MKKVNKMPETLKQTTPLIKEFTQEIENILGEKCSKVILYGAFARQEKYKSSEVDFMVLTRVRDSGENRKLEKILNEAAFEFELKHQISISIIVNNEKDFFDGVKDSAFYRHIKQEGIIVNAHANKGMNLIVAVDKNWAIGYKNELLTKNPEDLKYFKETTLNKIVVMGRKTLESLPFGLPLKQRTNIVLSTKKDYTVLGATVIHSFQKLDMELGKYKPEDIFVIGGESIYKQLLPKCKIAYVTKMENSFKADTWFPNLDERKEWRMISEGEEQTYLDVKFRFTKYQQT